MGSVFDIRHFGLTDKAMNARTGVDALAMSIAARRLAKKIGRTPELSAALAQYRQELQMSYVEH